MPCYSDKVTISLQQLDYSMLIFSQSTAPLYRVPESIDRALRELDLNVIGGIPVDNF